MTAAPIAPAARGAHDALDLATRTTIHHKARHLIGRYGYRLSDLPDLEQELAVDLLRRASDFDPARAQWQTFVSRCIDHRIADLLRARCCQMRSYERACHLDPTDDTSAAHTDRSADHAVRQQDLRLDLAAVVAALPERLRRTCRRLATTTVSEIAAEDGRSRWRVYRDIAEIRAVFTAAGLDAYC